MLEKLCQQGAPDWWKGSAEQFEAEFCEHYRDMLSDLDSRSDYTEKTIWNAAQLEVGAHRLDPLTENCTTKQLKEFYNHGKQRVRQLWTLEIIMDMWFEAKNY
jgi:hypothetical protein